MEAGHAGGHRGYDSVGAAVISGGQLTSRDAGRVDEVAEKCHFPIWPSQRGITSFRAGAFWRAFRWNADPILIPTATWSGAQQQRGEQRRARRIHGRGHDHVRSQDDGESCVHAMGYINRGYGFVDAIRAAYNDLQGMITPSL